MYQKKMMALINKIEKEINTGSLSYKGINYWPLIRSHINYLRKYSISLNDKNRCKYEVARFEVYHELVKIIFFYISKRFSLFHARKVKKIKERIHATKNKNCSKVSRAENVFWVTDKEHKLIFQGKLFSAFLDTIITKLDSNATWIKLTFSNINNSSKYYNKLTCVDYKPYMSLIKFDGLCCPNSIKALISSLSTVYRIYSLRRRIKKSDIDFDMDCKKLIVSIDALVAQSKAAADTLLQINPRNLFVTSYTGRFGIVNAAKMLGVKVIDIQHGGMHQLNINCTNYCNVPGDGYSVLPDFFWCWDKRTSRYISSTISNKVGVIVGGNPSYLLYSKKNPIPDNYEDNYKWVNNFLLKTASQRIVLYILQYGPGPVVPKHVIELYNETKNEWTWLFRLHPLGVDFKYELSDLIGNNFNMEFIDRLKEIPLLYLLSTCDVVLTRFSTTVRETRPFPVKSIIVDQEGQCMFSDIIDTGEISVALDTDSLRREISSFCSIFDNCGLYVLDSDFNEKSVETFKQHHLHNTLLMFKNIWLYLPITIDSIIKVKVGKELNQQSFEKDKFILASPEIKNIIKMLISNHLIQEQYDLHKNNISRSLSILLRKKYV